MKSVRLLNAYGPTEGIITASTSEVNKLETENIFRTPIGIPLPGRDFYIVDKNMNIIPKGFVGELCIGSELLASGYLGKPEITNEKFIPNLFDKNKKSLIYRTGDLVRINENDEVEFIGRIDTQVKIRGFRIELGEIESVLRTNELIEDAVVIALDKNGNKYLAAYVITNSNKKLESESIKNYLKKKLPEYMIPGVFVKLDKFPLTQSGKIDKKALPKPEGVRPKLKTEFVMPRTETEAKITNIVSDVLKVDKIGIFDNFFELGGHSMLVMQIVSRIKEEFYVEVSIRAIFENPTIAGMAQAILEAKLRKKNQDKLGDLLEQIEGLTNDEIDNLLNNMESDNNSKKGNSKEKIIHKFVPPRNEFESFIAKIWMKLLDLNKISIYDNFFELGGNREKANDFIKKMEIEFKKNAPPGALYQAPRLVDFATSMFEYYPDLIINKFGNIGIRGEKYEIKGSTESINMDDINLLKSIINPVTDFNKLIETKKAKKAIFLLSAPRSGSTLLRVMLAGNEKLFSPPELDLLSFNTLSEREKFFKSRGLKIWLEALIKVIMEIKSVNQNEAEGILNNLVKKNISTLEFYKILQDWIGNRYIVDKTPSYSLDSTILERSRSNFENPFFIHLIRNPYAMIYSFIEAKLDQNFFKYQHNFSRNQLAELIWLVSNENINEFLKNLPEEQKITVKFEELVTHPEFELRKICNRLQINYQEEMLRPYSGNKMTDGINQRSQMVGDFKFYLKNNIDLTVIDRWKKFHNSDFISYYSKTLAETFGYKLN